MALVESYVNNLVTLFKRILKKYKFYRTCRMLLPPGIGFHPIDVTETAQLQYNNYNLRNLQLHYHNDNRNRIINNNSICCLGNNCHNSIKNSKNWESTRSFGFFSFTQDKRKEFVGRKLVGFSMEQMFDVVSDVDNYKKFLPFCKKSVIKMRNNKNMKADLVIGFPPVVESYTSHITYLRPNYIFAESKDATLFNHLVTNWKFGPGLSKNPKSCVISFYISFEFKSILHSNLANMFFNELVNQMEAAFYVEALRRYGKATVPPIKLKILRGDSPNNKSNNDLSSSK